MKTFQELMLSNKAWSREMRERKESFFTDQTRGENPEILWIGCSDSRVDPAQITQTRPGEMFVHRNLANIVHEDDENLSAVLQVALEELHVRHVVVCGHYGCNGIDAALRGGTTGSVDRWLSGVRQVREGHADELDRMGETPERAERLVELNVEDQVKRLARTKIVTDAFARGDDLTLHGLVYNLHDGLITELTTIDRAA